MKPVHFLSYGARIVLVAVFTWTALSGCDRRPSGEEESPEPTGPAVVPVKVAQVYRGEALSTVSATGKTEALKKEKIFSPVAGTVVSLRALEGTTVHRRDLLAVIRPKEAQAAIAGAEALLKRAKTPAQEEEARKALALAESAENSVDLRAGFDGIVSARAVTEGELVSENAELFTLVDLNTLVFLADVPLFALAEVRPGENAEIRFAGLADRTFHGQVEALSPQSDPQSQTVRARLRFVGSVPAILRTEMAGTAKIVTGIHRQAVLIPRAALLHDDEHNTFSVVLVGSDSIARIVPVTVGALTDSTAELAGTVVMPGRQVVVEGHYALADSTKVSIVGDVKP